MKTYLNITVLVLLLAVFLIQCAKKTHVIEETYRKYELTTYMVDTFRFRVILDGAVLTDSLLSPQSSISKLVKFQNTTGRLQIVDAGNHDQLVLDSIIPLKIGRTKISLVQFRHFEKPATPPIPNEPSPPAGNYKIRFQFVAPKSVAVPYFDSVKFFVR